MCFSLSRSLSPCRGSNGTLPSASISPVSPAVQTRGARDPHLRHFLDLNGNLHFSGPAAQERSRGTGTTTSSPQVTGPMYQDLEETSEELPDYTCSGKGIMQTLLYVMLICVCDILVDCLWIECAAVVL